MSAEQETTSPDGRARRRVTIRSGTSRGRDLVAVNGVDVRVETTEGDSPPPPAGCPCASGF